MGTIIGWAIYANCRSDDLDALVRRCDASDLQYEGDAGPGVGEVSVRFRSGSPTLEGVRTEGIAELRRNFGELATAITPILLYREDDAAVFDIDTLRKQ